VYIYIYDCCLFVIFLVLEKETKSIAVTNDVSKNNVENNTQEKLGGNY